MNKKVLTLQDISCYGQCSITVALPILSACGLETAIIPSAVLSTHTGGFTGYTFCDLTPEIPKILNHWQKEKVFFSAIYSGYLGSAEQMEYLKEAYKVCGLPDCVKIVDPVMADSGKFYSGFDYAFAEKMKDLCKIADVILPNLTEASILTGEPYLTEYDESYIKRLGEKLLAIGCKTVIITGVGYTKETTGVAVINKDGYQYYCHKKIHQHCHGTGDIFSSAFTGALMNGKDYLSAVKIAADYVVKCIEYTVPDPTHAYGVKFEPLLPDLIKAIKQD